jgi:hypothetical protein
MLLDEQVTISSIETLNMKAHQLLDSTTKLCRRNFATGFDGAFTNPRVGPSGICHAVKWDICGALMHCYPDDRTFNAIFEAVQKHATVVEWVERFKKTITDKDMLKTVREHNRAWTVFNDYATYNEIHALLVELDV